MNKDPHFESLRRAYDERVKSLTKKLKSTYASLNDADSHSGNANGKELAPSASTHALQQRMQEIVESQVAGDKDVQLDSLLKQVATLKTAKKQLTHDLENVEKQSETTAREMKVELAHVQQQLADTRREHTRVLQQLKDNERYSKSEKEWSIRSMEEKFQYQDSRTASLEEQVADKNQELIALTEENREFRQRLERLYHERAKWQEEMMAQSRTQKNIAGELEETQRLLAQSEVERIQLRSQYVNVGEKFERLMDVEERENCDTVRQLMEKLKEQKERSERYKKKCDRLAAEGTTRQSELRSFATRLEDKDEEIARLTQRVTQETEKQRLVRSEMLEVQHKSFREQAACLEKTTSMIPIESHHQILDEQCQQQALALQEQQAQVQKLRNDLEAAEKKRAQELFDAISRTHKSVEDVERQRDESIKVGMRSEDECVVLRKALEQCDNTIRESTDAKKKLTISLEEAHQNMKKLRQLLDEEIAKRLESERTVSELRSELTCSHESLALKQKDLDHQARWAEEFETTFGKQLRGAEQEVDSLVDRCREFESKEEIHKTQCEELQRRIDVAETDKQHASQRLALEQQHTRRASECFHRLNSITQTQIESLRKEKDMLKDSVRLEFDHMASLWSSNVIDQWQRLCAQHSKAQYTKADLRSKLEEAVRQNSNMTMDCAAVQAELKSIHIRLGQVTKEKESLKRYSDSQEETTQLLITNMERMMMSVGEKSNLHTALGTANFSEVLQSARRSFNEAVTSRLEMEKEEARGYERDVWEKKYHVLQCDLAASQVEKEEEVNRLQNMLAPTVSPRAIEEALHRSSLLDQQSKTLNERVRLHLETS